MGGEWGKGGRRGGMVEESEVEKEEPIEPGKSRIKILRKGEDMFMR